MKALTLTQPWASLVVLGEKSIETRSWKTSHRGRIAIHAGKRYPDYARGLCYQEPFASALIDWPGIAFSNSDELPTGCILGTVELVSVRQVHGHTDQGPILGWPEHDDFGASIGDLGRFVAAQHPWHQEVAFGDYSPGRYAWLLRDPVMFSEPIPAKGALSLWQWEAPAEVGA